MRSFMRTYAALPHNCMHVSKPAIDWGISGAAIDWGGANSTPAKLSRKPNIVVRCVWRHWRTMETHLRHASDLAIDNMTRLFHG